MINLILCGTLHECSSPKILRKFLVEDYIILKIVLIENGASDFYAQKH